MNMMMSISSRKTQCPVQAPIPIATPISIKPEIPAQPMSVSWAKKAGSTMPIDKNHHPSNYNKKAKKNNKKYRRKLKIN